MADDQKHKEQALMWELVAALENMRDCFVKVSLEINDRQFEKFLREQYSQRTDKKRIATTKRGNNLL